MSAAPVLASPVAPAAAFAASCPPLPWVASERYRFVDAMRGIAALGVCCYHIDRYGPLREAAAPLVPEWCKLLVERGWVGVQMFFVISGFVIACSLHRATITPRFVGNFAFRRSLRLDPAYWVVIVLALLLHLSPVLWGIPSPHDVRPSLGQVVAHVFYVQNILGYENLSAGFWTLCIEMQFYLLYIVLLGVAQRLSWGKTPGSIWHGTDLMLVYAPLGLASLFYFNVQGELDDWIVQFFCMFFFGATAWWVHAGRAPRWMFWGVAGLLVSRLVVDWALEIAVALVAGLAIHVAGRMGRLGNGLTFGWLQWLGRVSYSLYLIHFPVSHVVVNLGYRATGNAAVPALLWTLLAVGLSLVAAQILYVCVEAPTVRFAARFKPRPASDAGLRAPAHAAPSLAQPV